MTSYPREMLKAGAVVICRCEGALGIAMTHADIAAAVLDATLGLSQFELDVIAERRRQVAEEGWTAEHDDKHTEGELALAAAAYAIGEANLVGRVAVGKHVSAWYKMIFPWDLKWWKPTSRRRDLVKSGALIFAEGDRDDRAAAREAVSS